MIRFELPPQPLGAALDAYARVSGRPVLYRDTLVAGRMSTAVEGMYTGRKALDLMLAGTGLVADDVGTGAIDAFVLRPEEGAESLRADQLESSAANAERYGGMVQARVMDALCADRLTVPGSYRALLRVAVDSIGRAEIRLLGSTGEGARDAAILGHLARTRFAPPPAGLPQPLTLIILPRTEIAGRECPGRAP
ncbi:STN domain-containing protein [Pigmentiphaga sp. YJ18]|uniref:STN domain-containing protein n=1 Tax=Pigmentiphaga sp. YJ18 TaxID=3134907 RepID=UPI0031189090